MVSSTHARCHKARLKATECNGGPLDAPAVLGKHVGLVHAGNQFPPRCAAHEVAKWLQSCPNYSLNLKLHQFNNLGLVTTLTFSRSHSTTFVILIVQRQRNDCNCHHASTVIKAFVFYPLLMLSFFVTPYFKKYK